MALVFVCGCSTAPLFDGTPHVVELEGRSQQDVIGAALVGRGDGAVRRAAAEAFNEHEHSVRVDVDAQGTMRVRVVVYRIGTPGRRVDTESLRLSTRSRVIGPDGRTLPGVQRTAIGQDEALARSLGLRIEERLARGAGS